MITPPNISTEDLIEFHKSHYDSIPLGLERLDVAEERSDLTEEPVRQEESDDGLGYYADGVKRTLTDKQIAFFRARELRKLAKQSQNRKDEVPKSTSLKRPLPNDSQTSTIGNGPQRRRAYPATPRRNEPSQNNSKTSVEETKPAIPILNSTSNHSRLYGQYESYVKKLELGMDDRYINAARQQRLQNYYPVLPLHEL